MPNRLYTFTHAIGARWRWLVGNPSDFRLEARVFHSTSLGIVLLVAAYFPYNLFAGMYVAALSCILYCGFFLYEYNRSRFQGLPHRSFLFGLMGLVLLSINYFANAGIEGSTDLIWPVYLLLLLTICPYRLQWAWVITYLIVFGLVHVAEHQYPGLVSYPFRAGKGQFTDRITAFPLPVISMAIIISLFRRNYDRERTHAMQRDEEKNRLLSILSHDLRAPFVQVRQYLELLDDTSLSTGDRAQMEQTLRQANDQTLDLVTNLLYWSRSQQNGVAIRIAQLDLLNTLKSTLAIAQAQAKQKDILLEQQIDPAIMVSGDADMLQLVVRNLLQNAIKFTPAGGTIRVTAETVEGRCVLSVNDTGAGIAPQQVETLFSGTVAPTYGTANEKGVGLGLQLCRDFMERQGGSITVESRVGDGSRFIIALPGT